MLLLLVLFVARPFRHVPVLVPTATGTLIHTKINRLTSTTHTHIQTCRHTQRASHTLIHLMAVTQSKQGEQKIALK